jgi:nitrous oxidase accessory protein
MKFVLIILAFLMASPLGLLRAKDIVHVDKLGEIATISEALRVANPGDEIRVASGVYEEWDMEITKPVSLVADGEVVIDGQNKGFIFTVRANDVTIMGFHLKNTGRSYIRDFAAILVEEVTGFVIADNVLSEVFFGIYLAETSGGIVRNNTIQASDIREASAGNGIHLWNAHNTRILNNTISGLRDGIYLEFAEGAEIVGNISSGNVRYGLHFMFSDSSVYHENVFTRNGAGVAVMYSKNIDMSGNTFSHNWGPTAYGLLLKDITHSTILNNRFIRNTVGLYSEASSEVEIRGNVFELNGYAVNIKSSSRRNHFEANDFIENSFDVTTDSPRNNNSFRANYWTTYEGYDLDRDGIGDVPYHPVRMFSVITQRRPESIVLLRSMLIGLLDTAERVMPVLTPKTLSDEYPRMERIND